MFALALTAVAFSPSLENGFTNWDDPRSLTENTAIRSLSWENAAGFFADLRHEEHDFYKPLVLLSHAVEYRFFGLDPAPYHATNRALHLVNTLLVFCLVRMLGASRFAAFAVSAVFGVHPAHVESVAWVSQRKDVLYSAFYLLALVFYVKRLERGGARYYALCLGAFILSLLSKPMAVTLPVVLLLIDFLRGRRLNRTLCLEKAPFFLASLAVGLLTIWSAPLSLNTAPALRPSYFWLTSADALVSYAIMLVWPARLSGLYAIPAETGKFLPFVPSAAVVLLFLAALWVWGRSSRKVLFGAAFFIATLAPALRMAPGAFLSADHYMYVPSIGIFYLAALALDRLRGAFAPRPFGKIVAYVLLAAALSVFSVWTWQRCGVWKDSVAFWSDVLEKSPARGNGWDRVMAHNGLGCHYAALEELEAALQAFDRSLAEADAPHSVWLKPATWINRANVLARLHRHEEAAADLTRAIEQLTLERRQLAASSGRDKSLAAYDRLIARMRLNRGHSLSMLGRFDEALADYDEVLRLSPGMKEVFNNRGRIRDRQGRYEEAAADYRRALEIDPEFGTARENLLLSEVCQKLLPELEKAAAGGDGRARAEAYRRRGILRAKLDDFGGALEDLGRAVELDLSSAAAWVGRGNVLQDLRRFDEALSDYDRALTLEPDSHEVHFYRSVVLGRLGRPDEAAAARRRFEEILGRAPVK